MRKIRVYMSGPMQSSRVHTTLDWRERVQRYMPIDDIDIVFDDPTKSEDAQKVIEELLQRPVSLDAVYRLAASTIVDMDMSRVEVCDILIAHWNEDCTRGAGTYAETAYAKHLGIPTVLLVSKNNVKHLPKFFLGCISHEITFTYQDAAAALHKRIQKIREDDNGRR